MFVSINLLWMTSDKIGGGKSRLAKFTFVERERKESLKRLTVATVAAVTDDLVHFSLPIQWSLY